MSRNKDNFSELLITGSFSPEHKTMFDIKTGQAMREVLQQAWLKTSQQERHPPVDVAVTTGSPSLWIVLKWAFYEKHMDTFR